MGCRCAKAVVGNPLQRRGIVQHVRSPGQPVLRRGDHQIEVLDHGPGAADVHQTHALVGARLNPAAGRLVAPARGNDQIRPGRHEWTGLVPDDAEQRERGQEIGHKLGRTVNQMLDLERPAEAFGERQDLRVVPALWPIITQVRGWVTRLVVSTGCIGRGVSVIRDVGRFSNRRDGFRSRRSREIEVCGAAAGVLGRSGGRLSATRPGRSIREDRITPADRARLHGRRAAVTWRYGGCRPRRTPA